MMASDDDYNQFMKTLKMGVKTKNKPLVATLMKPFVKAGFTLSDILNLPMRKKR